MAKKKRKKRIQQLAGSSPSAPKPKVESKPDVAPKSGARDAGGSTGKRQSGPVSAKVKTAIASEAVAERHQLLQMSDDAIQYLCQNERPALYIFFAVLLVTLLMFTVPEYLNMGTRSVHYRLMRRGNDYGGLARHHEKLRQYKVSAEYYYLAGEYDEALEMVDARMDEAYQISNFSKSAVNLDDFNIPPKSEGNRLPTNDLLATAAKSLYQSGDREGAKKMLSYLNRHYTKMLLDDDDMRAMFGAFLLEDGHHQEGMEWLAAGNPKIAEDAAELAAKAEQAVLGDLALKAGSTDGKEALLKFLERETSEKETAK